MGKQLTLTSFLGLLTLLNLCQVFVDSFYIVILMIECSCLYIYPLLYIDQGSHYFQIRGRSDVSFRELTGRRQQREVGRPLGEVNGN